MSRFTRDPERPPYDSLAEASALDLLLRMPSLIGTIDMDPLLVAYPEHAAAWRSMVRVHMRAPGSDALDFFVAWRADLCELECRYQPHHEFWTVTCRAFLIYQSLVESRAACTERGRISADSGLVVCDQPGHLAHPPHERPLEHWLARLRECLELRRLVTAAHIQADRAWNDDLVGSVEAALRVLHGHDDLVDVAAAPTETVSVLELLEL